MECLKIHDSAFSDTTYEDKPPPYQPKPEKIAQPEGKDVEVFPASMEEPSPTTPSAPMTNPSPMGAVAKTIVQARQQGLLDADELSEFSLYPVHFTPNDGGGNPIPHLEPLPLKTIRDLKQATSLYGIQAPYVRGLIQMLGNTFFMLVQDWKDLFRMILTGPQYVVWESDFRREAELTVRRLGGAVTTDHIFGSGAMAGMAAQAALPQVIFTHISASALRALEKVDDVSGTATGSFSKIHQGPNQPYQDFVLQLVVDPPCSRRYSRARQLPTWIATSTPIPTKGQWLTQWRWVGKGGAKWTVDLHEENIQELGNVGMFLGELQGHFEDVVYTQQAEAELQASTCASVYP
ncbi:hypothetical protein E2320_002111 [Naja naja]|nr:hypothetical protein E2320_002111 [Naja naja]